MAKGHIGPTSPGGECICRHFLLVLTFSHPTMVALTCFPAADLPAALGSRGERQPSEDSLHIPSKLQWKFTPCR